MRTSPFAPATDLDLWARNFSKPKAGNHALFTLMKTTGKLNNAENTNYAFGQELKTMLGHQAIFHGGGTGAYRAYLIRFPEQELSISVVSNNSYITSNLINIINKIAEILLPKSVPNSANITISKDIDIVKHVYVDPTTLGSA